MVNSTEQGPYEALDIAELQDEAEALLTHKSQEVEGEPSRPSPALICSGYRLVHLLASFIAGALTCVLVQYSITPLCSISTSPTTTSEHFLAPPYAGSTEVHPFPPTSPTNAFPSLFPTRIGYAGLTPTGAEPALVVTAPAYPIHTGASQLVGPSSLGGARGKGKAGFDIFKKWGNLSPWYSVDRTAFGLDSSPEPPDGCAVTGLHFLHRHGARYPTAYASYGGTADLAGRLHQSAANWTASGDLLFLNEWTYKLGEEVLDPNNCRSEILTPFGRQQLYDLGVSLRLKYGFLLSNFTESNTLPVFRTESQDRMLASAMNFAIGFFGWPIKNQYQQSITIEASGFNNTLAPYSTCPNAHVGSKASRAITYIREWSAIYLKDALQRLQQQLRGFELSFEDIYAFQQVRDPVSSLALAKLIRPNGNLELCAYETVALGYSKFCELFTEDEWDGFEYSLDLYFWYNSAFGSPVARVQGIGYINELVARLTHTPIETHNTSTNATLNDNPITFPLNQSLYVDATHEVVVLNIITALNLSNFAASGSLPADHIPVNRSFVASQLAPFATNVQFQLLSCSSTLHPQIRIIINDGVVPLTGIKGCPEQADGMCAVDTFVGAQKQISRETDWEWDCHGDWEVPPGVAWNTTTGDPPKRSQ